MTGAEVLDAGGSGCKHAFQLPVARAREAVERFRDGRGTQEGTPTCNLSCLQRRRSVNVFRSAKVVPRLPRHPRDPPDQVVPPPWARARACVHRAARALWRHTSGARRRGPAFVEGGGALSPELAPAFRCADPLLMHEGIGGRATVIPSPLFGFSPEPLSSSRPTPSTPP